MITVGDLDTPITIEKPSYNSNSNYGGVQDTTWTNATDTSGAVVSLLWSYMIWKGGGEKDDGDQITGETKIDFYIRYGTFKETIQPNWRVKYNNNYYYIDKIAQIDGRHKVSKLSTINKDNN